MGLIEFSLGVADSSVGWLAPARPGGTFNAYVNFVKGTHVGTITIVQAASAGEARAASVKAARILLAGL